MDPAAYRILEKTGAACMTFRDPGARADLDAAIRLMHGAK